jgi:hypothetical protein
VNLIESLAEENMTDALSRGDGAGTTTNILAEGARYA